MSGKSKRRRIRPHERAKVDQWQAAARDRVAADTHSVAFVIELADPGLVCDWCDCPFELHRHGDPPDHQDCDREAAFVVTTYGPAAIATAVPVCDVHLPVFQREMTTAIQPSEIEVIQSDAYDRDLRDQ